MSSHADRYLTKLLFGFAFISASVFVIVFACFERVKYDDWYGWGLLASVLLCFGVYLISSAFVHKMKNDLLKRQKSKEMQEKRVRTAD